MSADQHELVDYKYFVQTVVNEHNAYKRKEWHDRSNIRKFVCIPIYLNRIDASGTINKYL